MSEMDLLTGCRCGRLFRIGEAMRDDFTADQTTYMCPGACPVPVLIVRRCYNNPSPGAGYRFGEWMVSNPFDVIAFGDNGWTKLTASPHALD